MAEQNGSIFNKRATERLRSPDDLDRYIRVTSPGVWVMLSAVLVLVAGLLAWGVFGSVATSVEATGVCEEAGTALCLVDAEQAARIKVGDYAYVGGQATRVESISDIPYSRGEMGELVQSDYLVDAIMPGEWGYAVTFEVPDSVALGVPLTVSITTERIAPISLVLG